MFLMELSSGLTLIANYDRIHIVELNCGAY